MALVKRIDLRIALREYDCKECDRKEDPATIKHNNAIFTKAMTTLLQTLSQWKPASGEAAEGIELRIKPMSSSDSQHEYPSNPQLPISRPYTESHKQAFRNRQISSSGACTRMLGSVLQMDSEVWDSIAKVPVVTSFSISCLSYRALAASTAERLMSCLNRLEEVIYEYWEFIDPAPSATVDRQARADGAKGLLRCLPSSVRSLTVWRSHLFIQGTDPDLILKTFPDLSAAALEASYDRKNVAFSFNIWADAFFGGHLRKPDEPDGFGRRRQWKDLERLALNFDNTIRAHEPAIHDNPKVLGSFLANVARAIEDMPSLRLMEIWAHSGPHCLIRYEVSDSETKLTIVAEFDVELSKAVLKAWRRVADKHTRASLVWEVKRRGDQEDEGDHEEEGDHEDEGDNEEEGDHGDEGDHEDEGFLDFPLNFMNNLKLGKLIFPTLAELQ
ncbi:hypothetical protein C8034_v005494 [Colletotrichum sidae]|uniref:DUF6546 domain-containing protein n=1 Tax=Colletotrichum sidae TaxID=1347389 RepID=A0A4R8T6B7_9PEZI|nr:hypothetical protein C8034_v005494 [Colletotrichum sidae]